MHEGVEQLATLYPLCFFREYELRRPLKIGIREDIIAQHPELQPSVIVSALQTYTPLRALLQHAHGRRGSD